MVHFHTALGHDLFHIAIGDRVADIEKHSEQDHAFRVLCPFERYRHAAAPYLRSPAGGLQRADIHEKLRRNPLRKCLGN